MKFAIIGSGNTGQALAAYLASKGADCILNTRDTEKQQRIAYEGIEATGDISGHFRVPITCAMEEAVSGADYILVMTIAGAHREVAERLKPLLSAGQRVLIFNSNWGAFQFGQVLGSDIADKDLIIAETAAQLFLATTTSPGKVRLSVKEKVYVSATDPEKTGGLLEHLAPYFPQFVAGASIFETTLSSTNPVIHVPITLFNAVRVENAQHFLFYGEGVSQRIVDLILHIDRERMAVAKAMGCEIDDVLSAINSFWEIKHDNLYDALTKNETYLRSVGPKSFGHRFLTEDVPYGIAPVARLGRILGIDTPYTDDLLQTLDMLLGKGFFTGGPQFAAGELPISVS